MKYLGPAKPRRVGNADELTNPWGRTVSRGSFNAFEPHSDAPVRCPGCNSLIDAAYLYTERGCPNCHKTYTARMARDMSIEAMQVRVMNKNWKKEVLEVLTDKPPSYINKDLQAKPINDVARNVAATFIGDQEAKRRATIKKMQMAKFMSQSSVRGL